MNIAPIDIVFVLLIILFTVRCAIKGFISELMSMASVVLGLLASLYFYKKGGEFIRDKFMPDLELLPEVIAFIALFLIVFIVVKIIESMLKEIIEGIRLGGADRFLGVIFGIGEGIVVVSLLLFLFSIQPLFDHEPLLANSFFAQLLLPFITGSAVTGSGIVV